MARTNIRIRLFLLVLVLSLSGINALSNVSSILTSYVIGDLVFPEGERVFNQLIFDQFRFLEWFNWVVPVTLSVLLIIPVSDQIRKKLTGAKFNQHILKRVLDLPLLISLSGISGWVVEEALYLWFWMKSPGQEIMPMIVNTLQLTMSAILSFVISFFLTEQVFRKVIIPRVFPEGKLAHLKGNINVSIRGRFLIYFLAAMVFPVFILSAGMLFKLPEGVSWFPHVVLIAALSLLGIGLTFLVSIYYRTPLLAMKKAVLGIKEGDFLVNLPVTSNDELGLLSESLNDLGRELRDKSFMKETFGKVVDPTVRDHLLGGNAQLGGEERMVTVLFTDIRNYTGLTEKMAPETVVLWLNRYFDTISQVVTRHGGIVNKYIGDAVMALFGAPQDDPGHAAHAAAAAEAMVQAREVLNRLFAAEGLPQIQAGIGIHTGPVLAGNIGSSSRMEYTVIGDTVNVASRVEKSTKELNIPVLLTEDTVRAIPDRTRFVKKATCRLKGRSAQLDLFSFG